MNKKRLSIILASTAACIVAVVVILAVTLTINDNNDNIRPISADIPESPTDEEIEINSLSIDNLETWDDFDDTLNKLSIITEKYDQTKQNRAIARRDGSNNICKKPALLKAVSALSEVCSKLCSRTKNCKKCPFKCKNCKDSRDKCFNKILKVLNANSLEKCTKNCDLGVRCEFGSCLNNCCNITSPVPNTPYYQPISNTPVNIPSSAPVVDQVPQPVATPSATPYNIPVSTPEATPTSAPVDEEPVCEPDGDEPVSVPPYSTPQSSSPPIDTPMFVPNSQPVTVPIAAPLSIPVSQPMTPPVAQPIASPQPTIPIDKPSLGGFLRTLYLYNYNVLNAGPISMSGGGVGSPISSGNIGGFPSGTLIEKGTSFALSAQTELNNLQLSLTQQYTCSQSITNTLVNATLQPGIYCGPGSSMMLSGTLTFDGLNSPNSYWVIKDRGFFTNTGLRVKLINGAKATNIFWVSTSNGVNINTDAHVAGVFVGGSSIFVGSGCKVYGYLLSTSGQISISNRYTTSTLINPYATIN
jgi:hypothetical protein